MTMFKKAYRKSWSLGVCSGCLNSGLLWRPGRLDSGRLDALSLGSLSQEILSISFLLLVNAEFLIILGTL